MAHLALDGCTLLGPFARVMTQNTSLICNLLHITSCNMLNAQQFIAMVTQNCVNLELSITITKLYTVEPLWTDTPLLRTFFSAPCVPVVERFHCTWIWSNNIKFPKLTTEDSVFRLCWRASSSQALLTSKMLIKPSVDPEASVSGFVGWKHT
jgi:hypothetical protein